MRLIGPYPAIAAGKIRLSAIRTKDGVTILITDQNSSGLDELSVAMIGLSVAEADAFETAVSAFNNALALAKAKEAA